MKYTEILEQLVNEINMSPSSLRQLSANIPALAGMEFEMIVPNVGFDDEYYEPEQNLDMDEPVGSFTDIAQFFHDGDYNSRRDVQRLEQQLLDDYLDSDWLSERKQEEWSGAAPEEVADYIRDNYEDELYDQAVEETEDTSPEFGVNDEEFRAAVQQRLDELLAEKVESTLADMGRDYDDAYESWEENTWPNIWNDNDLMQEWLEDRGINSMFDVAREYDIQWPHWIDAASGGASIETVADDFRKYIGKKVNFSATYHSGVREPNAYVVEPDSSLEGDNAGDSGLEFVSPPMPIGELIADLNAVKQWAGEYGCYTNESTGLHINVSIPGFSRDKLDYVKLALLLGDQYVLDQFGRTGNTYTKSALEIVKNNIKSRPDSVAALLSQMREHLNTSAAKLIHSGQTSKYTSINTKDGYIEFRSPGGDWLDTNFDKIENTLLRFVVALDAALDENKYKEEYAKKLYKVLSPGVTEPDVLQLFANYSSGLLPKDALIRQVKQQQSARATSKGPATGMYWWDVWVNSMPSFTIQVVGKDQQEAKEKALASMPEWQQQGRHVTELSAMAVKPYGNE